jgi:hypothetical protein
MSASEMFLKAVSRVSDSAWYVRAPRVLRMDLTFDQKVSMGEKSGE